MCGRGERGAGGSDGVPEAVAGWIEACAMAKSKKKAAAKRVEDRSVGATVRAMKKIYGGRPMVVKPTKRGPVYVDADVIAELRGMEHRRRLRAD